ncbi:glycoside hydrolase family 92 protein [Solihabitans fulvus]|uniref:Glycoside hydrolase family 92 protein n=1 Tax=Solihabitans fulvus TaxID=1892852 RepID=A0A5B2WMW7_9PSEU|nr:lectin [Solihabitans fulvus]KAA2252120.1 glycoside hydrolase family 92 protein [Solihabitans fulvus]
MHGSRWRARPLLIGLLTAAVAVATASAAAPATAAPPGKPRVVINDPAQYVNPFVGTEPGGPDFGTGGGAGNTFPGADAPFGMVQWSPDTVTYQHGGYSYGDNRIRGFSLTHLSGAGCGDFGNIPFLPMLGSTPVGYNTFSHANEAASPGAYAVTFDNGLKAELAATQRSGIARFTYPAGQTASLLIDAGKAFNAASGSVTISGNTISGYSDSGGFCGAGNRYRVYFSASFDHPFSTTGVLAQGKLDTSRKSVQGGAPGVAPVEPKTAQTQPPPGSTPKVTQHPETTALASGAQAFVSFDTSSGPSVTGRVGLSFVSIANAASNASTEQSGQSFDAVRTAGRASWNDLLGRIAVGGGTADQLGVLYSGLYHSLLHPNVFSDVNGQYIGFDNQVHNAASGHAQYANFSGWDVYRSQVQLIALIAPQQAADIAQTTLNQAAQGGYADRWTVANGGTGVMVGDPLPIIAASIYAFGGTGFDAAGALSHAVSGSHDGRQRPGYQQYDSLGYLPPGTGGTWGPTATTLEYTSADFAVAQLANRLGDTATYQSYLHRAQNWRDLVYSGGGYLQPRNADKSWPGFSPTQTDSYVEGDAVQYTWMVPYNYRGLFDAMGGNASVVPRLDTFFTKLNDGPNSQYAFLGNEPTLEAPWAYDYAGAAYRAQDVVRRVVTDLFKPVAGGLAGNDDLGEMSSWVVWGSLGLYPEAPGRAELALASPRFPSISINRGGATITINAPGASDTNRYVQGLNVNGQATTKPWLTEDFVKAGGTLDYSLGSTANTSWGTAAADAPPSFDVGPNPPRTGPVTGLASKCVDVSNSGTTNGTKIQLWTCNSSGAQSWTVSGDGTLRALGKCVDANHSGTANGTLLQLWDCNGTGAQQWWPQAGGAIVNPESGRCVDVPNSNSTDGTQLQLYDCNGTGAQTWKTP